MGVSKSCLRIVILLNLDFLGPCWTFRSASWSFNVATLPACVLGVMKPRSIRCLG